MPKIEIVAGSRSYSVEFEEHELAEATAAASSLNAELKSLSESDQFGPEIPPSRLFMLAGLRVAAKLANVSEQLEASRKDSAESSSLSDAEVAMLSALAGHATQTAKKAKSLAAASPKVLKP